MKWVKAYAPATVANVCCGFDVLGFAMESPGDEVTLTLVDQPGVRVTKITGDGGKLPLNAEKNTAGVAILSFLKQTGLTPGVEIVLDKKLPLGSGMGSSAASAAAALVGINVLLGSPLTLSQLVSHGMESERVACGTAHADNVAPSILGGFVLIRDYSPLEMVRVPFPDELCCVLAHPHLEVKTEDSRRILKNVVTLRSAVAQSANIAGLMIGLAQSDFRLIGESLVDSIAEPVRSVFIPGFEDLRALAKRSGALGAGISGSGPTIFALCRKLYDANAVGDAVRHHFEKFDLKCDLFVSRVSKDGARITSQG